MENELARLQAAFEEWRTKKRYAREAVPAGLLQRARAAAQRHGPAAVHRATKVDRSRLKTGRRMKRAGRMAPTARVPAFSRVEFAAPVAMPRPFAEVEMPPKLLGRSNPSNPVRSSSSTPKHVDHARSETSAPTPPPEAAPSVSPKMSNANID